MDESLKRGFFFFAFLQIFLMPTCIWAFWGDKGELNDLGLVFFLKEIDTYVMEWNCTNMICMFFL